jgi:hypothetical protein
MTAPEAAGTPAFVVLAHRAPDQVARLVARLDPLEVFLHVDARVSADQRTAFEAVARMRNVTLVESLPTPWASWGLVAAALRGMDTALARPSGPPTHVVVMSGQDYPLIPSRDVARFFSEHRDVSFMARWPLPSRLFGRWGGMDRLRFRHRPVSGRKVFLPVPRRLPRAIDPYGGAMYWALNLRAARELQATMHRRPDLERFYRRTWIPDEMFVPTLVMNGDAASTVANESLTFQRWDTYGTPHPNTLSLADLDAMMAAARGPSEEGGYARRKLFARKIDVHRDPTILDVIDAHDRPLTDLSDHRSPLQP